jgi:hypothetical protein
MNDYRYDFGLSFAGAQRALARQLWRALTSMGYGVFFDEEDDEFKAENFGKNLVDALARVYSKECRFCVVLLSPEYEEGHWTQIEKEAIRDRIFNGDLDFFLPVVVKLPIPPWLSKTKLYYDLIQSSLDKLVSVLHDRAGGPDVARLASILRRRFERPDVGPLLPKLCCFMQKGSSDALKTSKSWSELIGADLFALRIRLLPAGIELESIHDYARIADRNVVLLGKPGSGKTTAVQRILATAMGQYELIPVQLARDWLANPPGIPMEVCHLLDIDYESSFRVLETSGRLLLIFDALDQVEHMDRKFATICDVAMSDFVHSHFLVTCREEEYRGTPDPQGFAEQHIQDLDWNGMKSFFPKMENPDDADALRRTLDCDHTLREICSNSFIFIMVARILRQHHSLPRQVYKIYDQFLKDFLDWEQGRRRDVPLDEQSVRNTLEEVAWHIAMESPNRDDVSREFLLKKVSAGMLQNLLTHGILQESRDGIRFFQQTFQEFLFASRLLTEKVFPIEFAPDDQGILRYRRNAYLSSRTLLFYKEMTGFDRIA